MRTRVACTVLSLLVSAGALLHAAQTPSPSGTVAGTIRGVTGTALEGLRVFIERSPGGTRMVRVDGDGRYQASVQPGPYHVRVTVCGNLDALNCPPDPRLSVYYPATPSREQATVITVVAGATRSGVDFDLTPDWTSQTEALALRLREQAQALWKLQKQAPAAASSWTSMRAMHDYFVAAFIATPGLGAGRMAAQSLRPAPEHRLRLLDDEGVSDAEPASGRTHEWVLHQLELIGIAKHDEPVVFSRVGHGTVTESTRPLTAFEERAIAALTRAGMTTSRQSGNELLVVGAIRAGATCLQCHAGYREGDMLGAFRYVLRRQ